jgi:hypothetical protein
MSSGAVSESRSESKAKAKAKAKALVQLNPGAQAMLYVCFVCF